MKVIEKINIAIKLWIDEINNEKMNDQIDHQRVPVQISKSGLLFLELVDDYMMLSKVDKEEVKIHLTIKMAWYLLSFGVSMATYSLRLSNQKYFTNGLFAVSMTFGLLDIRDILVILPLFCDAQKKNNLSFDEILKQKNDFSLELENFINRDEKDKSLECMGYIIKVDESNNQAYYYRTW